MKVLLHICCAPCSIVSIDGLRSEAHEATGFFFNPNIHPLTEYHRRLEWVARYCDDQKVGLEIRDEYDVEAWLRRVILGGDDRCATCYRVRLQAAAKRARELGMEAFTSTLFYSKYQKHDLLKRVAAAAADEFGIEFLYRDFRNGWSEGVRRSKEIGMYRQPYCGCIFSEQERYQEPGRRQGEPVG